MIFRFLARLISPHSEPEKTSALLDEVKQKALTLVKPAVALEPQIGTPVGHDPHSSIGGAPSLPTGATWPVEAGKPMIFLLQINYADMPSIPGYPESGLLSVFVQDEDIYGCGFPSVDQKGFRTTYYPDPTGFERASLPAPSDMSPYGVKLAGQGPALVGIVKEGHLTGGCYQAQDLGKDVSQAEGDAFYDWLAANRPGGIYYGGHPDFVQFDIRKPADDPALSEVVLQQGFVAGQERQWGICWGDAGEMAILIAPDDLADLRFEKTAYTWDCS
ncbi:MAG: DUF1963 domain-containing protein [Silicimonas sp.]|nr:DUF1963 domain-containing protein [Silicimonas sp.]